MKPLPLFFLMLLGIIPTMLIHSAGWVYEFTRRAFGNGRASFGRFYDNNLKGLKK